MVYIIHLKRRLHHAQHYIGFCSKERFPFRIYEHMTGIGNPMLRACIEKGIDFEVAGVYPEEGRDFEKFLKSRKNGHRICPFCNPKSKKYGSSNINNFPEFKDVLFKY